MNDTMEDNKDVDLYEELKRELDKSKEEEPSVASDQEPQIEQPTVVDESGELSEEEISKLSPRAQKRIRDLAGQVKEMAERPAVIETPEATPEVPEPESPNFTNVQDFLAAVEDAPSRKLLETFYSVIKGEISTTLTPIEQKNNETLFDTKFAQYEGIDGVADHKDDLKKTFLRDPKQDIEKLVGKVVLDLQVSKVKPIESAPSDPNRNGKVNTDDMSKDQLYEALETMRTS